MKILGINNTDTETRITIFNKTFVISKVNELYKTILSNWYEQGVSEELLSALKLLYYNSNFWDDVNKELWLIYICCLLKIEDKKTALKVLNRYHQLFGTVCIENFLPAAKLALENGFVSDDIRFAAELFDRFESAQKNNWLNSLQGKSIAIVGNGSNLIGSGKGKEIDSHDIVIRFNKFQTKGFEKDCGEKLDIWVTQTTIKEEINVDDINTIVLHRIYSYWNRKIDLQGIKNIIKNNKNPQILMLDDIKFARDCLQTDFYRPTTGCLLILAIYRYFNSFNNIDFYGFGFLNEEFKPLDHYYRKVSERHMQKAQAMHSFEEESYFLKQLIQGKSFVKK